jgi:hypothetical protein
MVNKNAESSETSEIGPKRERTPWRARIREHHLLQSAGLILETPGKRRIGLVTSVVIFLLSIGVVLGTLGIQVLSNNSSAPLPAIKTHHDIPTLAATTYADTLNIERPGDASAFPDSSCPTLSSSWVQEENKKTGIAMKTADWSNFDFANPVGSTLWLDKDSVSCGESFGVHASLYNNHHLSFQDGPRTIQALRVGWYNGAGARLMWSSAPIKLSEQAIPKPQGSVRMIQTKWPTTLKVQVTNDWVPGLYLINTLSPSGDIEGSYPLVVRSPAGSSALALIHSSMTWNAYNTFGGYSLYLGPGGTQDERRAERSRVASYDRPIVGSGANHIHRDAIPIVQFMEKQGLNVDQYMDTDLDQWPSLTTHYNGLVLSGHPEYATRRLQNTLFAARNSGTNLAFLGGNSIYWQARMNSSPVGKERHIVMYRYATDDPVTNPNDVTIQFDDKRINVPSTLLTGEITDGVHVYGNMQSVAMPKWLGLPANTRIDGLDPTSEVERTVPGPQSPPNIKVILRGNLKLTTPLKAQSTLRTNRPIAETSWYTAPSGAAVFNAGVTTWSCNLMDSCLLNQVDAQSRSVIETMATKVLTLWQSKAVGATLK